MFFQFLIYVFLAIGAVWLLWHFVFKEIFKANEDKLKEKGIILENPEPIKTDYTKQLEKLKKQHEELTASADAVEEALEVKKQMDELEKKIEEINKEMK